MEQTPCCLGGYLRISYACCLSVAVGVRWLFCVMVLQIDGMKNRVLMKRFNVLGFPSIYLLKDGNTWQYTGMRTVSDVSDEGCTGLVVQAGPWILLGERPVAALRWRSLHSGSQQH